MSIKTKLCTKCQKTLEASAFHKDQQKSNGLSSRCKKCKSDEMKESYALNRKSRIAASQRYYEKHSEAVCKARRKHKEVPGRGTFNKLHPGHFDFGASLRKPIGESSFARLVRQYKANATVRKMSFSLSDDEVRAITSARCCYCGVVPSQRMQNKDANGPYIYNGIDRVDNRRGYISGNCVASCKTCNKAKSNMTNEQWATWLNRVICFHVAGNFGLKTTLEKDAERKSA